MELLKDINILIVEDEPNLGDTLSDFLRMKGANVKLASNIVMARDHFHSKNFNPQIVLMDIGLPDGNGLNLAKEFRGERKNFVLLFLSALNDPDIKFEGLDLGAQDYITKPFDMREISIRLARILENKKEISFMQEQIEIGDLFVWFDRFQIMDGNGDIHNLNQKECSILELLYLNKNKVVSREQIIEQCWGKDHFPSNRTVDNYIVSLRKWLDSSKKQLAKISSIRGIGYKFEVKE